MEPLKREIFLKNYIENADMLNERNTAGIEKYRKGDFTLHFDTDGKKKITVKQTRHDFIFGSTAFMLGSFEEPEKEEIFKKYFTNLFTQAVVPLYWSDLELTEGNLRFSEDSEYVYRRPPVETVLRFCRENNLEPKGHCLTWHCFVPKWLAKYSEDERKKLLEKRFREISEAYSDKIPSFDIVNESASGYNMGRKNLFENYDEIGLELGKKYFANNTKILNETNRAIWHDYDHEGKYMAFRMQLEDFIRRDIPFDEIGLQFHMFGKYEDFVNGNPEFLNAQNMVEILDIFDSYNFPMHLSEITIPSYTGRLAENEAIQAELTETLYRTWFATRNMKSIIWWNVVDGYAAYAPLGTELGENRYCGGLVHFDMTPKPAYETLDRLINHEWKTSFETLTEGREYSFRGFYGTYEVTIEDENGKKTETIHFGK